MLKTKWTPGPWSVCKTNPFGVTKGYRVIYWSDPMKTGRSLPDEDIANAQLIAAAPEMLECLIKINEYAQISDDRFANYSDIINISTNEIIEKATGQKIKDIING